MPNRMLPRYRLLSVVAMAVSVLVLAGVAALGVRLASSGSPVQQQSGAAEQVATADGGPNVDPGSPLPANPAPGFTLTNQFGERVSLSGMRGKIVVLAFVDSVCTSICPLTTTGMLEAKAALGAAGSQVELVGINANPTATAVSDVRAYSADHGMANRWNFLTGTPAQLAAVWKAYHVYVAVTTTGIDHEPVVYVIDQQGRERMLYVTQMAFSAINSQAAVIAKEVASLLPAHPKVEAVPEEGAAIGPQTQVSLPSATGGPPVQLGAGHAHLVMFFDTWLAQTSDLPAQLESLNTYAAEAAQHGWPSLVAVDEAPVESSPTALTRLLRQLGGALRYPVVIDQTGRVADGYQVADAPWFTLTSPAGGVLLTNDGWFPVPKLEAAVAKALATHS